MDNCSATRLLTSTRRIEVIQALKTYEEKHDLRFVAACAYPQALNRNAEIILFAGFVFPRFVYYGGYDTGSQRLPALRIPGVNVKIQALHEMIYTMGVISGELTYGEHLIRSRQLEAVQRSYGAREIHEIGQQIFSIEKVLCPSFALRTLGDRSLKAIRESPAGRDYEWLRGIDRALTRNPRLSENVSELAEKVSAFYSASASGSFPKAGWSPALPTLEDPNEIFAEGLFDMISTQPGLGGISPKIAADAVIVPDSEETLPVRSLRLLIDECMQQQMSPSQ